MRVTVPTYDESAWPIVLVTMPSTSLSLLAIEAHLEHLSGYFQRNSPFGLLVDVRGAPMLAADGRRRVAEQIDTDSLRYPNLLRGNAIVLSTNLQRGVVSVIAWLVTRPVPYKAFTTIDDAKVWLRGKLL